MKRYQEVVDFIEREHRNPSKHRIEEHDHLNWLKANRKVRLRGWRSSMSYWLYVIEISMLTNGYNGFEKCNDLL